MRSKLVTAAAVIGSATVLTLAANQVAVASTGHGFLLGHANSTKTLTSLSRTKAGPALQVHTTSSSSAPFSVNGRGKVANLNADLLDGLPASALQTKTYVFTHAITTAANNVTVQASVPTGTYQVGYSAYLNGAGVALGSVDCYLEQNTSTPQYAGESAFTTSLAEAGLTGSAVLKKAPGDGLLLFCYTGGAPATNFKTDPDEPIQLTLTPIDSTSMVTARQVAPAGRAAKR
jgi:hypothetical protein